MRVTRWPLGVGLATVLAAGPLTPTATADGSVVLGGGAGIVVEGSYCTLATIGHDRVGGLVGFTAGHCGGPGAPVVAEGADNHGPVGVVAAVGDGLDYGVIKFDPAKVTPTANVAGFAVDGIGGPDPDWHQDVCTNGAANGIRCGLSSIRGSGPRGGMGHAPYLPGDDGSPVTCNGLLIGVVYGGIDPQHDLPGNFPHDFTNYTKFSAILGDVNAKGVPGAGFSPIPA
jgi:hypothetical protein